MFSIKTKLNPLERPDKGEEGTAKHYCYQVRSDGITIKALQQSFESPGQACTEGGCAGAEHTLRIDS